MRILIDDLRSFDQKKKVRKELAEVRARILAENLPQSRPPARYVMNFDNKDWPPYESRHGRGKSGWVDQRFYTKEQLDRDRERYLEEIFEELRTLGR